MGGFKKDMNTNRIHYFTALLSLFLISPAPAQIVLTGGRFAFPYPNLTTGAGSPGNIAGYATRFDGVQHNPAVYATWLASGTDPRTINPGGVYLKHVNFVTADRRQNSVPFEGRPDYSDILANHPQWIVRDSTNTIVTMYDPANDAVLDWGNDAYINYLIATTIPQILDSIDNASTTPVIYFEQDNGSFYARNYSAPLAGSSYAYQYNTDAGVQAAWLHLLSRLNTAFPKLKIFISSFPDADRTVSAQMTVFQSIYGAANVAGWYSECLTDRHCWWGLPGAVTDTQKRNMLNTMMSVSSWLADNGKYFMPMCQGDATTWDQTDVDYTYAVHNLFRKSDKQFYCKLTVISTNWVPSNFPEMDLEVGASVDSAPVSIGTDVWRRKFTKAEAYVNWSSSPVTVTPTAGKTWRNSVGVYLTSMTLQPFTGMTVYTTGSGNCTGAVISGRILVGS
jgi:hypothetical protein